MQRETRAPALARFATLAAFAALAAVAAPSAALASGTVLIQHAGQEPQSYPGARVAIIHNTLNVTSADGKGTLIITRAACSYQGDVYVCLPTAVTLVQGGSVNALDLHKGAVYANMTGSTVRLPLSSTQLPPNGILMTLVTDKGTYINLSGTIDKVTK
jgi:hypothetical protein